MLLDVYLGCRSAIEGEPVGPEFVPYKFPEKECLELHVVGECRNCKFWAEIFVLPDGLPQEAAEDLKETHRQCDCEESPVMVSPKDFGCVHFKNKEKPRSGLTAEEHRNLDRTWGDTEQFMEGKK